MKYCLTDRTRKILWAIVAILALAQTASARETLYVMDVTMHGSTYSRYASNPEFDVTKNSYSKTGDLAPDGIQEMYRMGQQFRNEFITSGSFLPPKYDSNAIFLESIKGQPGLMSAYAFILGAYSDSVSYLNLNMNNAQEHQRLVRKTLGLSDIPTSGSRSVKINTDEGFMYWSDASHQCPALYKNIHKSLALAGESASNDYNRNLFPQLASTFGRSSSKVNFETAHKYLDDYQVARRLGNQYPKFSNQANIDRLIEDYERDYYYNGVVGGNEIPRVISTPLLNYALINIYAKSQEDCGNARIPKIHMLKHSHFFTDEISFAGFLKALGQSQSTAPKAGQNVRLELFETNGEYYVNVSLDGKPMNFAGSRHGIIELDAFLKTIYPKLYFGDIDAVCIGREEISLNVFPQCQDYQDYLSMYTGGVTAEEAMHVHNCRRTTQAVAQVHSAQLIVPPPHYERPVTVETYDAYNPGTPQPHLVDVQYVEKKRPVAVPVPVVEERVVEKIVEKPYRVSVPVIEEKVVVHEVEKVVSEKPTHIHHIDLAESEPHQEAYETPAPTNFAQGEEDTSWPWWMWLIPLLCCCLCLIPCLAYLLCCRKKEEYKEREPIAPVIRRPVERDVEPIKDDSYEKKYVIEKKEVDDTEKIEQEITRELRKSRARETTIVKESSPGKGRRKRIKTIKKFGEVIGKEIQYLDEDGNVLRTERAGVDEMEARSERYSSASRAVGRTQVVTSGSRYAGGSKAGNLLIDTYEREGGLGSGVGSTGNLYANRASRMSRASRRGYSSGRHMDTAGGYVSGSNAGLVEDDAEYGRYSPGGTRMSRVSRKSGSRAYRDRVGSAGGRAGSGNYRSSRYVVGGGSGTGNYREYREERITKGGTTRHKDFFVDEDDQI